MNAFLALVRKDLVLHFSNRRAVIMSIAAPILIAAFFGFLFGDRDSKAARIPLAVIDQDRSELSARLVAALRADTALELRDASAQESLAELRAGKLRAVLTLPAGFGAQAGRALFGGGAKPGLLLQYDPSPAMALQVIRGLLAEHAMQAVSQAMFSNASPLLADSRERIAQDSAMPAERRRELTEMFDSIARVQARPDAGAASGAASGAARGFSLPYTTHEEEAGARPEIRYNSFAHSFAGMGVQFMLLMGVDIGIGLLTMRRMGLWQRLRAAPLSKAGLLGSRVASCALIVLIVFAIIYAAAIGGFGVRIEGSVIGFIAVLVAFALLTASFGLLIAALGRTPEATRGLAILATLLMVMLGGAWVPSFIFPEWLQRISLFVPTRWAVDGLDAMTWRGLGLDAALLPVAVMLVFTAVFAAVALARFQWEE